MIFIKSLNEIGNYNDYDEVWAIVRKMKYANTNIKQVADLSPSKELFYKYCSLKKSGKWNKNTFNEIYVPQFLQEMLNNNAVAYLNRLKELDEAGKNVVIACFCTDETTCHRSIIAGILQGYGCNVNVSVENDYIKYYERYKNMTIAYKKIFNK